MRESLKYGSNLIFIGPGIIPLLTGITTIFFFFSCNQGEKHNHISTNTNVELDGLVKPTSEIVFSDVKTINPVKGNYQPVIKVTGVISYDPRLQNTISLRFSGRIEKLYVKFNYEEVAKGQRIMDIYSPEILTEQQHYILLLSKAGQDTSLISSAKERLQLLGLSVEQIKRLNNTRKVINPLPVYSPYRGHIHDIGINQGLISKAEEKSTMSDGMSGGQGATVTQNLSQPTSESSALAIKEGMYIQPGQAVFSVFNTDEIWAILNIFPTDAALIQTGDKVSISLETNPERQIISKINYIEPVIGQNASAIQARVYLPNLKGGDLKIGSLIAAEIQATERKGVWIPRSSIANLGHNKVVFIKSNNYFRTQIIQTEITTDSLVQVTDGLQGNELIAVNAQFLVDSESFISTSGDE